MYLAPIGHFSYLILCRSEQNHDKNQVTATKMQNVHFAARPVIKNTKKSI